MKETKTTCSKTGTIFAFICKEDKKILDLTPSIKIFFLLQIVEEQIGGRSGGRQPEEHMSGSSKANLFEEHIEGTSEGRLSKEHIGEPFEESPLKEHIGRPSKDRHPII